jgi:hypothetical protein
MLERHGEILGGSGGPLGDATLARLRFAEMPATVFLLDSADAAIVPRLVLRVFAKHDSNIFSEGGMIYLPWPKSLLYEDEIAPSPGALVAANLVKDPTNQRPPNPPAALDLAEALDGFLGRRWLGADRGAMEPHGVDAACLVERLRSAPAMAARFAKSSVQSCRRAKAALLQASPVHLSSTHKLEDRGD